jgi:tetratricopeptide (TPR) repeat protein
VLEDLHRADRASLEELPAIVARLSHAAVLFLFTLRPEPAGVLDDLRRRLGESSRFDEVRLGPLTPEESMRLVDAVAGEGLSADARELVLARAAGHPARLILATFLEPALRAEREHRQRKQRSSQAERRRATILFADITGFTSLTERAGAERAYPIVVGCLKLLDGIARKHGGTVEKHLGDCVMALFGVPEAIEDAPRAAVNAAIEMARRVREYSASLGPDVGLMCTPASIPPRDRGRHQRSADPRVRHHGRAGERGRRAEGPGTCRSHLRRSGGVSRDPRGFAYREIGADTREAVSTVPMFELLSRRERLHRARIGEERRLFSGLVGRDRELDLLCDHLRQLGDGRGGILNLIAEAGIGKSRLLAELASRDEVRAVAWLEGRSVSTGQNMSFHPIADLCRNWAGIREDDEEVAAHAKLDAVVRAVVRDEVDDVLPFIATILGLPPRETWRNRLAGVHGDAMEKLVRRSFTQLLSAGSRVRPIVVVMDDLHWADLSSIELLESLLRLCEEHAIAFINLFRPGAVRTAERVREQARTRHGDRYTEIELEPLDPAAARRLLNNLFRQGDIPQATRQLIEEKARGKPFYIEEVVCSLVDAGAVEYRDGRFRATEKIGSVVIPGTIQEVVMARVDGLDLRKRQLLQTASVIGGSFHVDVLAGVVGNQEVLDDELDELVEAEFPTTSDRLSRREFTFRHPLLQEVTYDSLLHSRREELHRKVGEAMERTLPEEMPGYAGMLAYHYGKGKATDRAEAFLFRAGADAARAAAPSEALHFFEEASRLYVELHGERGDPEKRSLLEKNIAQALYYRGRFIEAIEHFNLALGLLGDPLLEGRARLGLRFAANLVSVLARLYVPRWGRRPSAATARQREIMDLRYARAEATATAQPTRHVFDSMESLALLQRIDPATVPESGRLFAGAAALFAFGGISFDVSRRLSAQARSLVSGGTPDDQLYERAMSFIYRVLEGDWSDEHEIDPQRIEESIRRGQLWGPTTYLGLLGEKRIRRGDFAGAHACLEQIDRIWDLFQYDLAKTNHYYLLTLIPLEQGDLPHAIEAANAYYEENPEDLLHILALGAKAKAQTLQGLLDAAEETLAHAREVVARSSPVPPFHGSAYHRSRLLLDLTRLEAAIAGRDRAGRRHWTRRARASARVALRSASKVAWRRTEVLRLAARYHWLLGHHRRARRLLERSIAEGERLGARPETARTFAEVGRLLRQAARKGRSFHGLDGDACVARARAAFESLGFTHDLERLRSSDAHAQRLGSASIVGSCPTGAAR